MTRNRVEAPQEKEMHSHGSCSRDRKWRVEGGVRRAEGKKENTGQETRLLPEWRTREGKWKRGRISSNTIRSSREDGKRRRERKTVKKRKEKRGGRKRETRNGARIRIIKVKMGATVEGKKEVNEY
jgi:hypothetical protein